MMKKTLALILSSVMALSLCACSDDTSSSEIESAVTTTAATQATTEVATDVPTEAPAADTIGQTLLADFRSRIAETPDIDAQTMADALLTNPVIEFSGVTMPVENGLLTGFGNEEITGFESGVVFSPMIGTIPFMGYIFTLAEGSDVDAFVSTLESNANPAWNICTTADETIVEASGNTVFFLMSPINFEEE